MTYVPLLREDYGRASPDARRGYPPNPQEPLVLVEDAGIGLLDRALPD